MINDGFTWLSFLLIGLEVKRETLEGALKSKETAIFLLTAAVGGGVSSCTYLRVIQLGTRSITRLAIPAATDIAFALGIMVTW